MSNGLWILIAIVGLSLVIFLCCYLHEIIFGSDDDYYSSDRWEGDNSESHIHLEDDFNDD